MNEEETIENLINEAIASGVIDANEFQEYEILIKIEGDKQ